MVKKTVILFLFLLLIGTPVYAGEGAFALNNLKAVNVNINIHDRVGRGLNKTSVKADLLKHIKA